MSCLTAPCLTVPLPYTVNAELFKNVNGNVAGNKGDTAENGKTSAEIYHYLVIPGLTNNPESDPITVDVDP